MKMLIEKRKKVDPQDNVATQKCWNQEIEVLSVSLENTIKYLNNATEDEIYWTGEIWEDISMYFKSEELLKVFYSLKDKFPKISGYILERAKEAGDAYNYVR